MGELIGKIKGEVGGLRGCVNRENQGWERGVGGWVERMGGLGGCVNRESQGGSGWVERVAN